MALREDAKRRGWSMVAICQDVASGKSRNGRPGLVAALKAVELGQADALVTVKIDRLSRSLRDFVELMDRSVREGWALVTLDLRVDTTTPHGKAMARMAGVFAELERDLIVERTKVALAIKKAQGVRLCRPVTMPEDVRKRMERMRANGLGWTAIAQALNGDGVPTAQGGQHWYPSTVRAMFIPRQAAASERVFSGVVLPGSDVAGRGEAPAPFRPQCLHLRGCTIAVPTLVSPLVERSTPVASPVVERVHVPFVPGVRDLVFPGKGPCRRRRTPASRPRGAPNGLVRGVWRSVRRATRVSARAPSGATAPRRA